MKFLVYHSGWQCGVAEDHPFNTADAAPLGVDRLIKAVLDNGLGPNGNVYAELGTTWFNLMSNMNDADARARQAAQVPRARPDPVGNRLLQQRRTAAADPGVSRFQIPESMQAMYGYPALTPEVKRKIFGLNAAAVYGVDVADRCAAR